MKKTVSQNGMTLVALIVTIVILLILAVVAINAISDDGIVIKVNDAVFKHNQKVIEEKEQISWLERLLGKKPGNQGGSADSGNEGGSAGSGNTIEPDYDDDVNGDYVGEHGDCYDIWYTYYDKWTHHIGTACGACQQLGDNDYGYEYHSYNRDGKCICGHKGEPNTTTRPNPS